ncbi:MAG: galactose oxidase-like domain-containing protein [Candidatus Rokuibacteriota bacterium]
MRCSLVRRFAAGALGAVALLVLLPRAAAAQSQDQTGQWTLLSYTTPINPIHTALMRTGKILIASGSENDPTHTTFRAAVYDPTTGAFAMQTIPWDLFCNAMSQLPDGRLLITGGTRQYNPFRGLETTSIFDPSSQTFIQVQDMARGRWYPSNALLADGRTMVFSGWLSNGGTNNAVELYSVPSGWSPEVAAPFVPPLYPWLHLLPGGRVFLSGWHRTTRMFDPATQTWTPLADTNYVSATAWKGRQYGSSVLLPLRPADGYRPKVMIMGGDNPATNTAEIIDLGASPPSWRWLPSMALPRVEMNAVILPTGKVLALGGSLRDNVSTTASLDAELFDPATETWSPAGRALVPRLYHSVALLLPDARVWVAGANPFQGFYDNRLEIYAPPYLFAKDAGGNVVAAARPTIGAVPTRVGYNASFAVSTPNAADVGEVVLVRPGSSTHAFDFEQRLVQMAFTAGSGALTVTSPPDSNVAPPGYYMLFLIDRKGVPSVARFVQLAIEPTNQPPDGTITNPGGTVSIQAGQAVTFAGSGTDPDGTVTQYSWVFPSGSPRTSTAPTPGAVTFPDPGRYVVSLTVTDNDGDNDPTPATRTIVVTPPGFTATITSPPDGATVSGTQTVGMEVSGGGTAPFAYVLKVDGIESFTETTSSPSSSYLWNTAQVAAGSHTLTLEVTDSIGGSGADSKTVDVDNTAALAVSLASPGTGETVGGIVAVNVGVTGGAGPYNYTITVDDVVVGSQSSSATNVAIAWDTSKTPNGRRTLVATVQTATKTASTSVDVTVQNGTGGGPPGGAFTLSVVRAGSGTGTVISDPAGLDCGATCSTSVGANTRVTLTATAAAGSVFAGWSGAGCAGIAPCSVLVTASTAVTATFVAESAEPATLVSAVLPSSRSVQAGTTATAFATIINAGTAVARVCSIGLPSGVPATFAFQSTDPQTNALTGSHDTPVDIPPGASRTFVIAVTPSAALAPTEVAVTFDCANSSPATVVLGLNTLLMSASAGPIPDIVALVATPNNNGIVETVGPGGSGAFAVAAVNVGTGDTITVSADTGSVALPIGLGICQTNPATGACLGATAASVTTAIGPGATPSFGVFVTAAGPVAFDPAVNRVFVRFRDASGVTRGSTSVAVRTR